jgi:hypothetical protein
MLSPKTMRLGLSGFEDEYFSADVNGSEYEGVGKSGSHIRKVGNRLFG